MNILGWLRDEWALMRADAWRRSPDGPEPCTRADPRCAATIARQDEMAAKMHADGKGLLDWKRVDLRAPTVLKRNRDRRRG